MLLVCLICVTTGAPGGGGGARLQPPKAKFKKKRFCRHNDIKGFYMAYPSANSSHLNWLTTNTLEY